MFSPDVERALRMAQEAHAGQTRKGDGSVPYIVHPIHAALILARVGADETAILAGILHDVVEDCEGWTLERVASEFGEDVSKVVAEVTEDKSQDWPTRKQTAIDHVPQMSNQGALVKAADKLHNLSTLLLDLRAATDHRQVWQHFNGSPEATLAMSRGLVEALARRLDGGLGKALVDALEALELECGGLD